MPTTSDALIFAMQHRCHDYRMTAIGCMLPIMISYILHYFTDWIYKYVHQSNYNRADDVADVAEWQPTPKTADVTVIKIAGYVRVRILMNR